MRVALVLASALIACSGGDGVIPASTDPSGSAAGARSDAGADADTTPPTTDDGGAPDAGTQPLPSVFDKPFQGGLSPGTANAGGGIQHGGKSVTGTDCMASGCHSNKYLYGGTVFFSASGEAGAFGAEVRVVFPNGEGYSTFTDIDGNFWFPDAKVLFAAGARVGVRSKDITREHKTPIDSGACSSATCHGADRVHLN